MGEGFEVGLAEEAPNKKRRKALASKGGLPLWVRTLGDY